MSNDVIIWHENDIELNILVAACSALSQQASNEYDQRELNRESACACFTCAVQREDWLQVCRPTS